ncbi:MAG: PKD domain-containing protein, partial [Deltaproteobacteria bacterium]|nr:PKD domain-containing protein [Deltaproteobacteria bacterium]
DNPATDNAAKAQLEAWFPGRKVYVIEMLESWIAGGGVHCHTNDQPAASTIGSAPSADFSAASTLGPAPFDAYFTDLSTHGPTVWEWTFGDGGASTDRNPVYTYESEGTYSVSLTARNAAGLDTLIRNEYITVPEPHALLQLVLGCLGLSLLNARRSQRCEMR